MRVIVFAVIALLSIAAARAMHPVACSADCTAPASMVALVG